MGTEVGSLYVSIGAKMDELKKGLEETDRLMKQAAGTMQSSGNAISADAGKVGTSLGRIGEIASGIISSNVMMRLGDSLVNALRSGVDEALAAEVSLAKVEAIVKSTGGSAGVTSQEMVDLAESLQKVTRFSDDANMEAISILLTFTNLGKDVLPTVLKRSQDLSTVFNMDLASAARLLGRALNDPAEGFGTLSRVIGKLPKDTQAAIEAMAEAGDQVGAMNAILDVMNTKFGGTAEEVGQTTAGSFDRLKNALLETGQTFGDGLLTPMNNAINFMLDPGIPTVNGMIGALQGLGDVLALSGQGWEMLFAKMAKMSNTGTMRVNANGEWELAPEFLPMVQQGGGVSSGIGMGDLGMMNAAARDLTKISAVTLKALQALDAEEFRGEVRAGEIERLLNEGQPTDRWAGMNKRGAGIRAGMDLQDKYTDAIRDLYPDKKKGGGLDMDYASVLARAFGGNLGGAMAWQSAFSAEHGGAAPGATDVRDKLAGDLFFQKHGRAATQGEWEQRYYKGSFEGLEGEEAGLDAIFGPNGTMIAKMDEQKKADEKNMQALIEAFRRETDKTLTVQFANKRLTD